MTTLANIRMRLVKLEDQVQALKTEFQQAIKTIARTNDK